MKGNQRFFLNSLIISVLCMSSAYAQESIVAAGGSSSGPGGTSTFSVGQIVYTSLAGNQRYAIEGIQQPYEIATLGKDEFSEINLVMSAYPNPATDILNLVVTDHKFDNLSCSMFDINGKVVSQNLKIVSSETTVSMQGLNQGIYFLKVNDNAKNIKTFKIIKK